MGGVKRETIEQDKNEIFYTISRDPSTKSQLLELDKSNYRISQSLKELEEERKIISKKIGNDIEYFAVNKLSRQIYVRAKRIGKGLLDSLKAKIFRKEFAEENKIQITERYPPITFSAFLAHASFSSPKNRKTNTHPTGIEVTEYLEDELVRANKTYDRGNIVLEMEVVNADFPKYESMYDEISLSGTFRRKPKEVMRISTNQEKYLLSILGDMEEISLRTISVDLAAKQAVIEKKGDRKECYKSAETLEHILAVTQRTADLSSLEEMRTILGYNNIYVWDTKDRLAPYTANILKQYFLKRIDAHLLGLKNDN